MEQNDTIDILQKDYTLREAVNRMEQKLSPLPADLNERVMGKLSPLQRKRAFKRRYWLYPAIAAVAASILIIIGVGVLLKVQRADEPLGRDEITNKEMAQTKPQRDSCVIERPRRDSCVVAKRHQVSKAMARHVATIPDTLGSGIFKSERNVVLAVQMLNECETCIKKGEQSVRNTVVEATYHAIPQPNTTLVVCETGDYQIVGESQQTIIEI